MRAMARLLVLVAWSLLIGIAIALAATVIHETWEAVRIGLQGALG